MPQRQHALSHLQCRMHCASVAAAVQAPGVEPEQEQHILYANAAVTYASILIKVYVMFEHALHRGARWLLKTDDDAYVNIPQTVQVRPLPSLSLSARSPHTRRHTTSHDVLSSTVASLARLISVFLLTAARAECCPGARYSRYTN